ncbi:MAG: hypothetical protein RLZZ301_776 [Bacteroidota bacterium]
MSLVMSACQSEKKTTLEVSVCSASGQPLANAKIWLQAEPTDTSATGLISVNDSTTSDANGMAYFDLSDHYKPGQIGVMVIKVKGFYYGLTGESIAEITEEQRNQVNVLLQ